MSAPTPPPKRTPPRKPAAPKRAAAAWRLDLSGWRPPAKEGLDPYKAGFALVASLYVLRSMLNSEAGSLLNGIIFYTHEGGHLIFSPFGLTLTIAGGTLMQLLVPVAFAVSFVRQGSPYSMAIVGYWLAYSFVQASVYAGDAIAMELPLSTTWTSGQEELDEYGETGHDWHNLLVAFGLLHATPFISGLLRWTGYLVFAVASYFCLLTSGVPVPARWRWPGGQ